MEILRFEEAPTSAPKRKKSSRSFIALGFVATLFGVSTAFASSTITINSNTPIALGQGVSVFTTCDTKIGVEPVTELKEDLTSFGFKKLKVGTTYNGDSQYLINNAAAVDGGCLDTDFVVKFYDSQADSPTTPVDVCSGNGFDSVAGTTSGSSFVCRDSAIYFRVALTSHEIMFDGTKAADFFDHISIETASGITY
jgi:hypothetical protein